MQDGPLGHGRYHRPAVEPPADDGAGAGTSPPSAIAIGVVALLILGGAIVAWLVPLASVVLVWPILFFVPGWVVIRRVVPDLPMPGRRRGGRRHEHLRVGAPRERRGSGRPGSGARRSSSARSSWPRRPWSSRSSAIAGWRRCTRPTRAGVVAALRDDAPAWIVAAAAGLAVLVVLGSNGWHETPDGWVAGGWNWSDLLVHVSIGSSIAAGNFPPEVPYFAGRRR